MREQRKRRQKEFDNKVSTWAKTKYKRPEKIDAEDVLERQQEKREERQAKIESGQTWRSFITVSNVLGILAMIGAGIFAFFGTRASDQYDEDIALNKEIIASLEKNVSELDLTEGQEDESIEMSLEALDEAGIAAQKVAEIQNKYPTIKIVSVLQEDGSYDDQGVDELNALIDELMVYFPTLERSAAGRAWYVMSVKDESGQWQSAPAGSFEWRTGKSWTMTGPNSARVIWEARELENDYLLAWAVGNWNNSLGGFDSLSINTTHRGQVLQGATDGFEEPVPDVLEFGDFLNEYLKEYGVEPNEQQSE